MKEIALKSIEHLPDNATLENILEELEFQLGTAEGLAQVKAGLVVDHEDIKKEFLMDEGNLDKARAI